MYNFNSDFCCLKGKKQDISQVKKNWSIGNIYHAEGRVKVVHLRVILGKHAPQGVVCWK